MKTTVGIARRDALSPAPKTEHELGVTGPLRALTRESAGQLSEPPARPADTLPERFPFQPRETAARAKASRGIRADRVEIFRPRTCPLLALGFSLSRGKARVPREEGAVSWKRRAGVARGGNTWKFRIVGDSERRTRLRNALQLQPSYFLVPVTWMCNEDFQLHSREVDGVDFTGISS